MECKFLVYDPIGGEEYHAATEEDASAYAAVMRQRGLDVIIKPIDGCNSACDEQCPCWDDE